MIRLSIASIGLLALGFTAPAHALQVSPAGRVWVSAAKGDDADPNCGPVNKPCRSFQHAHDIVAAGGEIDVLDPGGYGAVNITKSVSIINDGVGVAGVAHHGANGGITISAGAKDVITLRGLTVTGGRTTGFSGLFLESGGELIVANCTFKDFATAAVYLAPTGAMQATFTDSLFLNSPIGFEVTGAQASPRTPIHVTVVNGAATNNSGHGFISVATTALPQGVSSATPMLFLVGTVVTDNLNGVTASGGNVQLSGVKISNSSAYAFVTSDGTIASYNNNAIDGAASGNLTPLVLR